MPGRNGTGPLGQGAMTGRGLGVCTGANVGACGSGRGFGMGLGRGFGRQQKAILENQLEAIRKQLDHLSEDSK